MNNFRNDLKRAFASPLIWISSIFLIAGAIINLIRNLELLTPLDSPGALNLFIYGPIMYAGGVVGVITPIIAVIPFSTSLCDDLNSGFIKHQLMRMRSSKYIWQRICSTAFSGGMVFVVAFVLYFLGAFIADPTPSVRMNNSMGAFTYLYYDSLLIYCVVYILTTFVVGASYSLLGLGIGTVYRKKFAVYVVPAFLYHVNFLIGWLFPKSIRGIVFNFIPFELFDYHNVVCSIPVFYLRLVSIGIIGIALTIIGYRKFRVGKW
jgi:hypothetical protein